MATKRDSLMSNLNEQINPPDPPPETQPPTATTEEQPEKEETIITSIHIPRSLHELLKDRAYQKARRRKGARTSVSGVIIELLQKHRDELTQ